MIRPPLIVISPCVERAGIEMGDLSISLSESYQRALMAAGALPLVLPCTTSPELLAEAIARADGLLLTGGDDICPELYDPNLDPALKKLVHIEDPERDYRELRLIEEAFRQHKAMLGICRGHQILNVALGGSLVADLPTQRPSAVAHRRMDAKREVVHEVALEADSLLARITGRAMLGVNSTHHQAVDTVAPALQATGCAADGVVEVLELKPALRDSVPFFLSVQFHPERLVDRYPEHMAIFQHFVAACLAAQR